MQSYIVHYGELGLKGRNRPQFLKRLAHNIRVALLDLGKVAVRVSRSYLMVEVDEHADPEQVRARLSGIFGIAYFAPTRKVEQDPAQIEQVVLEMAQDVIDENTSFKVQVKRGDKRFPMRSIDAEREWGALIVARTHAPVRLQDPDVTVNVQIYPESTYIFSRRFPGARGLPVGSAGRVVVLLSGGIDSPVAAHMMLKRGAAIDFLHFHMLRTPDEIHQSKVVALARQVMAPHRLPAVVHMIPAQPFQMAVLGHESRVETVVFRRFILKVAEHVARRRRALALVTGDNLGQVASQTLKNLYVTSRAVEMPILRPLVAFDKQEIVELAQNIGTYELSIAPYQDPCSMHAHRPATWAKMAEVRMLEAAIDIESVVNDTLAQIEEIRIEW
ncbi:MAG: tRNA 4-thiouridine(8) synthase ThiI [Anaerolineae bacterium]|nr:tRNA 4-thiouridine(8) synthase ThiI [Anaerolineae bacterium]